MQHNPLTTINHTTVEALGFRHSLHNGRDTFTRGDVRVTFDGDVPTVSVGDRMVEVEGIEGLKGLLITFEYGTRKNKGYD